MQKLFGAIHRGDQHLRLRCVSDKEKKHRRVSAKNVYDYVISKRKREILSELCVHPSIRTGTWVELRRHLPHEDN